MPLSALIISQIQLQPVEPPGSPGPERASGTAMESPSRSPSRFPLFQGGEKLNHMIDSLIRMGFHPVRSNDYAVGSLQWRIDMSAKGYRVQEYRAQGVREVVQSLDMETGRKELISTDPMDISLIVVRDTGNSIVEAYLIRRILHRYRTGETGTTTIIEKFVRNPD